MAGPGTGPCYLLTGPGVGAALGIEAQGGFRLGHWIPDIPSGEVGVPGRGHELEEPAGPARAVDRQRVVAALALSHPERPGQPGAVAEDGVDRPEPAA